MPPPCVATLLQNTRNGGGTTQEVLIDSGVKITASSVSSNPSGGIIRYSLTRRYNWQGYGPIPPTSRHTTGDINGSLNESSGSSGNASSSASHPVLSRSGSTYSVQDFEDDEDPNVNTNFYIDVTSVITASASSTSSGSSFTADSSCYLNFSY